MTKANSNPKNSKTLRKLPKAGHSDTELTISPECENLIDIYLNHQRSIDTLNSFLRITPSNDDYFPVLVLIADQLNRTFLDVIPVFASSSNKSRGPTNTNQPRAR